MGLKIGEKSLFNNNDVLLVTGGTGSFGNAVVARFLNTTIGEIRILAAMKSKTKCGKDILVTN